METNEKHTSCAFFWNQKSPPPKKNLSHRLGDPNKKTTTLSPIIMVQWQITPNKRIPRGTQGEIVPSNRIVTFQIHPPGNEHIPPAELRKIIIDSKVPAAKRVGRYVCSFPGRAGSHFPTEPNVGSPSYRMVIFACKVSQWPKLGLTRCNGTCRSRFNRSGLLVSQRIHGMGICTKPFPLKRCGHENHLM